MNTTLNPKWHYENRYYCGEAQPDDSRINRHIRLEADELIRTCDHEWLVKYSALTKNLPRTMETVEKAEAIHNEGRRMGLIDGIFTLLIYQGRVEHPYVDIYTMTYEDHRTLYDKIQSPPPTPRPPE